MELSQAMQKQARSLKADVEMLVMADLICLGYSETDAFNIAYSEQKTYDRSANKALKDSIEKSAIFKRVLNARAEQHQRTAEILDVELMDKGTIAKHIMKAAMQQPQDSKERIEGLMKYADLMGMKKEDTETDGTETIHFFLPLKCDRCPLLKSYNESAKEDGTYEVRPVEMERVVRLIEEEKQDSM